MISRGTIVLLVIAFIAALVIGLLYAFDKIDPAQTLNISALTTLVLLTAWYAKQTTIIARETKEQRYSESLPLLVPDLTPTINAFPPELKPNEIPYLSLQAGVKVKWCNFGRGVAINTRFSFWGAPLESHPGKILYFPPRESKVLIVNGEELIDFDREHQLIDQTGPRLIAEYQDIYEREITTVQEFRIDKENKRAFLGELYFTINGRRLGKEVAQHD